MPGGAIKNKPGLDGDAVLIESVTDHTQTQDQSGKQAHYSSWLYAWFPPTADCRLIQNMSSGNIYRQPFNCEANG